MAEGRSLEDLMKEVASQLDDLPPPVSLMGNDHQDKSLEELMKDVAGKLDNLPVPKPLSQPVGDIKETELPGLENLVNRLAENLDGVPKGQNSKKEDLSEHTAAEGGNNSLEDMLRTLNKNIRSGDWLVHNTAEKWVSDNPELAEEYKKAASQGKHS